MNTTKTPESKETKGALTGGSGEWTALQLRSALQPGPALQTGPSRVSDRGARTKGPFGAWPIVALLLVAFYLLAALTSEPHRECWGTPRTCEDITSRDVARDDAIFIASAAALLAGMAIRKLWFRVGMPLIGLGCVWAIMLFWTGWSPLVGVYVIVGASRRATTVINKNVFFWALVALVTAVYVGMAIGVGTIIGSRNERNLILPLLVSAAVIVALQPLWGRIQRFANRLVFGKRATPYEVLADFADRVAETYSTEDVLPRMALALQEGTGADRAEVWLRSGDKLRLVASSPSEGSAEDPAMELVDGELPAFPGVDRSIEVRHQGELLGAFTVTKAPGETVTRVEDTLMRNLASQAGLVMRNVGLTAEVFARLEELKASRQRLVAAQDQERRRLERNLHDGAQQHLVALKVKLRLVERATTGDEKISDMLAQLGSDADDALEALRELARGIYPPLLADQGLATALEAQARKASLPVEVNAPQLSRHPQEVEAAVYFCCLEALQNVAKHAHASSADVQLTEKNDRLVFSVHDNGRGFAPSTSQKGSGLENMLDRIEALDGTLEIHSSPQNGTTIIGSLPTKSLLP